MVKKRIRITRIVNGKKHISHLSSDDVVMHMDIIDKLIEKCIKLNVPTEQIDQILENGYERED
jgi:UPF0288 family protein (methanogenesis marker protein 3)